MPHYLRELLVRHVVDGRVLMGGSHQYPESAAAGLWCRAIHLARFMWGIAAAVQGEARTILLQALAQRVNKPIRGRAALGVFSDRGVTIWHEGTNHEFRALMTADLQTGRIVGQLANSEAGMAPLIRLASG